MHITKNRLALGMIMLLISTWRLPRVTVHRKGRILPLWKDEDVETLIDIFSGKL